MKKKSVHPAAAVVIVLVAVAAVWFVYTFVLSGQHEGQVGSPATGQVRKK